MSRLRVFSKVLAVVVLATLVLGCTPTSQAPTKPETVAQDSGLPRLLDIGNGTCVPCKQMKPVLEDLKQEYRGKFAVEYIELRDDRDASSRYKLRMIPTQIFYSASGEELYRHEGFFSKEEIVTKWEELGVGL